MGNKTADACRRGFPTFGFGTGPAGAPPNPKQQARIIMMRRRLTLATALCAMLLLATAAWSGAPGGDGPAGKGPGLMRMLTELDLSVAQKREVAGILKANRDSTKALRDSVKSARDALRGILAKTPGDEAAVRAGAKAVADAAVELAVARGRVKAAIDAVLTPEQRTKRDALREALREKWKARRLERQGELDAWIESNLS
jgi:protein CpxP